MAADHPGPLYAACQPRLLQGFGVKTVATLLRGLSVHSYQHRPPGECCCMACDQLNWHNPCPNQPEGGTGLLMWQQLRPTAYQLCADHHNLSCASLIRRCRTFLHWMNVSVTIGSISAALSGECRVAVVALSRRSFAHCCIMLCCTYAPLHSARMVHHPLPHTPLRPGGPGCHVGAC